jgi:hypothetical protein
MTWTDRILDDGTDREHWLASRLPVIGASDAAKLAKPASVDLYLAQKLERREFNGNEYTDNGNEWEPDMLAWAGITPNHALIHSPEERGFAATPDGLSINGFEARGAECKAKHNKVVFGPTLGEWRQVAWQFNAVPELDEIDFIWAELVQRDGAWVLRGDEPKHLTIKRSDPKVRSLLDQMLPIATDLLARLTAALEFERGM